ncbi:MAG: DUF1595 domain-containing protein, partial [Planctomycetia bacterium]|nr:DUF1595 domain-containing protein [Planctomycetia bacterium]
MTNGMPMLEARVRRGLMATAVVGILFSVPVTGLAQTSVDGDVAALKADGEQHFRDHVAPFIKTFCLGCHSSKRPTEAGLNFTPALKNPGDAAFSRHWKKAFTRVKAHDMPPDYATKQPTDDDRQKFVDWLPKVKYLSRKDPGLFVIRRLTKTEYGNTLHDLFGVDRAIASELPDEVSGEGYLNSLSPLQLEQYLAIAEKVLDRVLAPQGGPPTEMQKRLLGEPLARQAETRTAAREVARSLARKAYRRPATEAELNVLLDVFDLGRNNGLEYPASLRLMLKAILVSPQFLFITPANESQPRDG